MNPDAMVTAYIDAPNLALPADGTTFAYRELGPRGGVPVVFFMHLAGTLDNWDPRIIDPIAAHRHVIAFDNLGVGGSSGSVPPTIEQAAEDAYRFITALGLHEIDVFSFSMGGMIAQDLIAAHPGLVRRLILAGTGPRGGKDIDKVLGTTYYDVIRAALARSDAKEFLFFNRDSVGKQAGKGFIQSLATRSRNQDAPIRLSAFQTQLRAIQRYGRSAPTDLSNFSMPTLIANGDNDRMVPSALSEDLHERIAGSELVIYPNAGHGSIFQYHDEFVARAVEFLGT